MARPREFDEAEILERGVQLFWSRGFSDLGTRELLAALGIGRQSFYNAFGDKASFFHAALSRYQDRALGALLGRLSEPELTLAGAHEVVLHLARGLGRDPQRRACLLVNSTMELGGRDPAVRAAARRHVDGLRSALTEVVSRARERGEARPGIEPREAAVGLTAAILGLHVMARAHAAEDELVAAVDGAFRGLSDP